MKLPENRLFLLPALVVAPFLPLFLIVALARFHVPFQLEWNEGQAAEQALRFAEGKPLYPAPESGWVPYMYAPLYHMVLGAWYGLTGHLHLMWGRVLSFLATIATATGIWWTVRNQTRNGAAALMAALFYFAYFQPCGFWYDIARNDALAFAFCVWGVGLCLSRDPKNHKIIAGLSLLALGTLTKQTVGPVALWCALVLVFRRERVLLWLLPAIAAAVFVFLSLMHATNSEWFLHYTIGNALTHASDPSVWRNTDGVPPRAWREGLQHVLAPFLLLVCWMVFCFAKKKPARGLVFVVPILLLAWGAFGGFAKFGGYRNNFLSMFGGASLLCGLAFAGLLRCTRGGTRTLTIAVISILMVFQTLGMYFHPGDQIPGSDSRTAHDRLVEWLDDRQRAGHSVLVLHHQWYGVLTGQPPAPSIDMVRCATWAGDPVPDPMFEAIAGGRYEYLIIDAPDLAYDWLAPGIEDMIRLHYRPAGVLPVFDGLAEDALLPVTGAPVRPTTVLRRRAGM